MGQVVLAISIALLGITVRNLLGPPSKRGIVLGWIAMAGFAALAAYCFWKIQGMRGLEGSGESIALGQKFMLGYLFAMMLAAYGVSAQRLKLRREKPPAPTSPS